MSQTLHYELKEVVKPLFEGKRWNLLTILILHANVRGRCWPSMDYMYKLSGISLSTLTAAKQWLLDHKAIEVVPFEKRVGEEIEKPIRLDVYQLTGCIEIDGKVYQYLYTGEVSISETSEVSPTRSSSKRNQSVSSIDPIDSMDQLSTPTVGKRRKSGGRKTKLLDGMWYAVREDTREIGTEPYDEPTANEKRAKWEAKGYRLILGEVLNTDPLYREYTRKTPRSPVFDAFVECVLGLKDYDPDALNGNAAIIGKNITAIAQHAGIEHIEVRRSAEYATQIRKFYKDWRDKHPDMDLPFMNDAFQRQWLIWIKGQTPAASTAMVPHPDKPNILIPAARAEALRKAKKNG